MFLRLRHPSVVRRDDQKREIDRADARNHVANKILVPGHVHDSNTKKLAVVRPDIKMGKAELDRNLTRLFFRESIGIDAGQGLDQRALPMIDVSRRSDDEMPGCVNGGSSSRET